MLGSSMQQEREELCKKFAKRIRDLRMKEFGERKAWAAGEALGISQPHYSRLEAGLSVPSLSLLLRFCSVYRLTPDELLEGLF